VVLKRTTDDLDVPEAIGKARTSTLAGTQDAAGWAPATGDMAGKGNAIFDDGQDFFRLARWELWQFS
jgi:hypothetical protein